MERWILAVAWVTLPVTAGGALADATAGWSTAPQIVAAALGWGTWTVGLLAILVPRPVGLTAVRTLAPCYLLLAVLVAAAAGIDTAGAVVAVLATLVVQVLAARPSLARLAGNAAAYGDEQRFPLRVPPALYLGPLPAARLLLGAAVASGPLLLADERWVLGAVAVVLGVPVGYVTTRALHGLSTRWAVLVPAGFVVVDPLTLSDPVLFLRERIVGLRPGGAPAPPGDDVLDLRLGATIGTLVLAVDRPAELFRATRGRRGSVAVRATQVCVALVDARRLLAAAAERRIPVTGRNYAA